MTDSLRRADGIRQRRQQLVHDRAVQGNAIRLVALQHQVLTVFCQLEAMERINCDGEWRLHVCTPGRKQIDDKNGRGLGFIPFSRVTAWDLPAESGIGETRLEQVDAFIALRRMQSWSQRNLLSAECMHNRPIYDQASLQFYADDVPDRSAMSKSLT